MFIRGEGDWAVPIPGLDITRLPLVSLKDYCHQPRLSPGYLHIDLFLHPLPQLG